MSLYALILKQIQLAPMSLADLQTISKVSLPTLRKAVQELSETHWIRVVGQSETQVGRPAMLFGLDDAHFVVLGVHLQLPGMRMIVTDLTGNVLDESVVFRKIQPTPEDVLQAIVDYAKQVETEFPARKILGLGIAAPGFTDPESGNIITIGRVPGWESFPICQRLQNLLNVPVRIANDVDCMAFAEFQHTGKAFSSNLTFFGFDEGIKVSMFLNGELYKGASGNAGLVNSRFLEIPQTEFSPKLREQLFTISGISEIFEEKVSQVSDYDSYDEILNAHSRKRMSLLLQSDLPICREIHQMLIKVVSTAIANITYVIQPDVIVVGGALGAMSPTVFADLSTAIRKHLPTLLSNRVNIEKSQLSSENCAALGAHFHFLESYLNGESVLPTPQ